MRFQGPESTTYQLTNREYINVPWTSRPGYSVTQEKVSKGLVGDSQGVKTIVQLQITDRNADRGPVKLLRIVWTAHRVDITNGGGITKWL